MTQEEIAMIREALEFYAAALRREASGRRNQGENLKDHREFLREQAKAHVELSRKLGGN